MKFYNLILINLRHFYPVFFSAFSLIKQFINISNKLIPAKFTVSAGIYGSGAEGYGHRQFSGKILTQFVLNPFYYFHGLRDFCIRKNKYEFLSSEPAENIAGADIFARNFGKGSKYPAPFQVAAGVVDIFEIVEIYHA